MDGLLATLERELGLVFADGAFQTKDDLLTCLGLLVEDGLGLTTKTGLFTVCRTRMNDGSLGLRMDGWMDGP